MDIETLRQILLSLSALNVNSQLIVKLGNEIFTKNDLNSPDYQKHLMDIQRMCKDVSEQVQILRDKIPTFPV